jgi:hypothetical protein
MNKAQRLELIRARFRRNRPIQELAPKPTPQTKKQAYHFHPYGLGNPAQLREVATQWIYAPREVKDLHMLKPRRIKRISPLTMIAVKLPRKLMRIKQAYDL